ncbi:MAG: dihydroorotase [Clostridia bacterium]|nr:dihydroorotase [Clostridia bacterium]
MSYACSKEKLNMIKNVLNSQTEASLGLIDKVMPIIDNCFIFPGFVDVHVHLREPGFSYKETIFSGTRAAAHGGYTHVFSMPNLNPVPDSLENLNVQLDIIKRDGAINVYPYGAITIGEKGEALSDMRGMAPFVKGFSDDGRGVQSEALMEEAMRTAKALGKIIVAHCEDNSLLKGGYINDCEYAAKNGHRGICNASEWKQIERDLKLAEKTGCSYHVCHISTKESVEIIRDAKKSGVDVTCETAPHYLLLDDSMLQEHGRFKMNPPLRGASDRQALTEGLLDGTVDMIATDHAPHSLEEKSRGLKDSLMGVTGIETAFSVLYTGLVKSNIITIEKLVDLLCLNAAARFGLNTENDFSIWNIEDEYNINPSEFISMGKSTPFEGMKVFGKCLLTVSGGRPVWIEPSLMLWRKD